MPPEVRFSEPACGGSLVLGMLTDRIRDTLGREINVAGQLVRQALDAHLRQVGDLNGTQVILLMVLACERTTPLEQLRRDTGSDPEELAALLGALQERGYLEVDADAASVTAHGEQAIAALWTVQERVEEELLAGFSEQDRQQLRDLLRRVQDNATRISAAGEPAR